MKNLWKLLGAAALVAGLTPYRVEKNEETDETSYQALLWKLTNKPDPENSDKRKVDLTISFNPPSKKNEEKHLFADELTINYHPAPAAQTAPAEEAPVQEAAAEEPSAEAAPSQEEAPSHEAAPQATPEEND